MTIFITFYKKWFPKMTKHFHLTTLTCNSYWRYRNVPYPLFNEHYPVPFWVSITNNIVSIKWNIKRKRKIKKETFICGWDNDDDEEETEKKLIGLI